LIFTKRKRNLSFISQATSTVSHIQYSNELAGS
jgi:hypothetical protein